VVAQGAAQVRRRIALRPQGAVQRKAVDQRVGLVGQGLRVLPGTQGLVVGEQQQGVPYRESGCVLGLVADGPQRWIAMGTNVERQLHLHLLAPVGVPGAVVERLNREVNGLLAKPEFRLKLSTQGVEAMAGPLPRNPNGKIDRKLLATAWIERQGS